MEILILGIILVAIMVWASTRIKRTAAAAFDAETVETEHFTIKKPDGWLSVVEPKAPYLFEAYTKDFGAPPNEGIRLGTASVEAIDDSVDEIVARETVDGEVIDELREIVGGHHYRVVEMTLSEDDVDRLEWLKFADAGDAVYTFRVKVLADATDAFRRDIEAMVDSFEIR